jgi:hypothetical protein
MTTSSADAEAARSTMVCGAGPDFAIASPSIPKRINASWSLLSRSLQIVDRLDRNARNAAHERKASSCRPGRTSKSECANVDDVKKLEL